MQRHARSRQQGTPVQQSRFSCRDSRLSGGHRVCILGLMFAWLQSSLASRSPSSGSAGHGGLRGAPVRSTTLKAPPTTPARGASASAGQALLPCHSQRHSIKCTLQAMHPGFDGAVNLDTQIPLTGPAAAAMRSRCCLRRHACTDKADVNFPAVCLQSIPEVHGAWGRSSVHLPYLVCIPSSLP